jgi:hypothetical protein
MRKKKTGDVATIFLLVKKRAKAGRISVPDGEQEKTYGIVIKYVIHCMVCVVMSVTRILARRLRAEAGPLEACTTQLQPRQVIIFLPLFCFGADLLGRRVGSTNWVVGMLTRLLIDIFIV